VQGVGTVGPVPEGLISDEIFQPVVLVRHGWGVFTPMIPAGPVTTVFFSQKGNF
jgi:hypothetical protein